MCVEPSKLSRIQRSMACCTGAGARHLIWLTKCLLNKNVGVARNLPPQQYGSRAPDVSLNRKLEIKRVKSLSDTHERRSHDSSGKGLFFPTTKHEHQPRNFFSDSEAVSA